ncbi:MAG TPA: substrate-binding domain-containing protein [Terriglobales bacterium]|nr:substrate-binding domain-containing protein [Terriglobales bacterium]
MEKYNFLVSVTNTDNDYQREQETSAKEAARRLGISVQIVDADNDPINQSQQLLKAIQAAPAGRPHAIIFEPVGGTALPQVARAAANAGIGWVVLNREVDYVSELRKGCRAPIFAISSDHTEIGRIQGRQFAALLPKGGTVLYIQGPSGSLAAQQRTTGMYETKPANVQVRTLKGQWTEASSYQAVSSWLRLRTSHEARIDLISGQDDSMALGARKALEEQTSITERQRWLSLPFTGCDGMPDTGQAWVRSGLLAATVVVPANTGQAIEMLTQSLRSGSQPQERTFTAPLSFPPTEKLAEMFTKKAGAASV